MKYQDFSYNDLMYSAKHHFSSFWENSSKVSGYGFISKQGRFYFISPFPFKVDDIDPIQLNISNPGLGLSNKYVKLSGHKINNFTIETSSDNIDPFDDLGPIRNDVLNIRFSKSSEIIEKDSKKDLIRSIYASLRAFMIDKSVSLKTELHDTVLDGIELFSAEDLLPIILASNPNFNIFSLDRIGGIDSSFYGNQLGGMKKRLHHLGYNEFLNSAKHYKIEFNSRSRYNRNYLSNSVKEKNNLFTSVFNIVINKITDYPLLFERGSSFTDENTYLKNLSLQKNLILQELQEYLIYLKFKQLDYNFNEYEMISRNFWDKFDAYLSNPDINRVYFGSGKIFDDTNFGRKESLLRIAIGTFRIENSDYVRKIYFQEAQKLLFSTFNIFVTEKQVQAQIREQEFILDPAELEIYQVLSITELDIFNFIQAHQGCSLETIINQETDIEIVDINYSLEKLLDDGCVYYTHNRTHFYTFDHNN